MYGNIDIWEYRKLLSSTVYVKAQNKRKLTSVAIFYHFCGSKWRIWKQLWAVETTILDNWGTFLFILSFNVHITRYNFTILRQFPHISLYFEHKKLLVSAHCALISNESSVFDSTSLETKTVYCRVNNLESFNIIINQVICFWARYTSLHYFLTLIEVRDYLRDHFQWTFEIVTCSFTYLRSRLSDICKQHNEKQYKIAQRKYARWLVRNRSCTTRWKHSTQLLVKRTRAADIKSGTFSLFGLMHLIKCGLAALILSMRIPKDVLYEKNITIITTDLFYLVTNTSKRQCFSYKHNIHCNIQFIWKVWYIFDGLYSHWK